MLKNTELKIISNVFLCSLPLKITFPKVPRYGFRVSNYIHSGLKISAYLYLCFIINVSESFRQAIKYSQKSNADLSH